MTTTRVYLSTDAGAPVITGQVGTLSSALQACLVGTAGVAYGSGPTAKTAAGWTAPFTGTNKVALKNSVAAGGTGMLCRLDDNAPGAGGAREAFMTCYFSMTDVDTGVGITPTAAQITGGGVVRKSASADSTPRAYAIVADELTWYMAIVCNSAAATEVRVCGAGDFESYVASDPARFFCLAATLVNATTGGQSAFQGVNTWTAPNATGLWLAQGYAGAGSAINAAILALGLNTISGGSSNTLTNPAAGSNDQFFYPCFISAEGTLRGHMRGLYMSLNNLTGSAVFTNVPGAAGVPTGSNLMLGGVATGGAAGRIGIETALEW